ncbi:protein adenylyltransferase SelO-like [Saccostrea cucullata]|uniref:protein adenylyltransferase SelO-like n=1 Tax=Saccostrea cuccullata TaxID=36930 RepID=UPI002ED26FA0
MSSSDLLSLCLFLYIVFLCFPYLGAVYPKSNECKRLDIFDIILRDKCPCTSILQSFKTWRFDRRQVLATTFPLDPILQNYVRQVPKCLFSAVYPIPFKTETSLVSYSKSVLNDILDLSDHVTTTKEFVDFVSGSQVLSSSVPLSHRYGGHQFGYWAGQLGDGRAVMLGEYTNQRGERWELQLKGSGGTPYSRQGDGRAVLRSSVREFLCSEAMFHLGIPTSRAAALVVSDDPVMRDQFYDGHPRVERGAVILRLAYSWFRIGSLEILAKNNELQLLRQLLNFVIENYFLHINSTGKDKYLELYSMIVSDTAELIAQWQSVGFTHGVCNTDNFSLLSITIDYGPFGFMEDYNPKFVPNSSDDEGRYSYEKQPDVGVFNLEKLGEAIKPVLTQQQQKQLPHILKGYESIYKDKFMKLFRQKLGLYTDKEDDENLLAVFIKIMEDTKSDFTMSFRELGEIDLFGLKTEAIPQNYWALNTMADHEWFWKWIIIYKKRLELEGTTEKSRQSLMNKTNPRYILRNWMAQEAIEKADRNDFSGVNRLLGVLERPMDLNPEAERAGYSSRPPEWSKSLRVSCSS